MLPLHFGKFLQTIWSKSLSLRNCGLVRIALTFLYALDVNAISNPVFPLVQSVGKNLLKLYLNDVGLLTSVLYGNNIRAVLDDESGINLGSVYESVVAQELAAHGYKLFYYDNRSKGEVDYLIDASPG